MWKGTSLSVPEWDNREGKELVQGCATSLFHKWEQPWGFPVVFDASQDAVRLFSEKLNLNPHYLDELFCVLTSCQTLDQESVSELNRVRKNPHTSTKRQGGELPEQTLVWDSENPRDTECVRFRHPPAFIKLGSITPLLMLTMAAPFPRVSAVIKQLPKCQAEHKGY